MPIKLAALAPMSREVRILINCRLFCTVVAECIDVLKTMDTDVASHARIRTVLDGQCA